MWRGGYQQCYLPRNRLSDAWKDETRVCRWCGRRFKPEEKNQECAIPRARKHITTNKRKEKQYGEKVIVDGTEYLTRPRCIPSSSSRWWWVSYRNWLTPTWRRRNRVRIPSTASKSASGQGLGHDRDRGGKRNSVKPFGHYRIPIVKQLRQIYLCIWP